MGAPAGIDWEWAKATGGSLTAEQRRALLKPLARTVVGYVAGRLRLAVGLRGKGRLDIDALRWPDSTLAKEAEAQAREVLSVDLLAHSYRTYLFGLVLAQLDGVRVDEEVCYVASLRHDLQLGDPTPGRCFAVAGGERAERFALDQGTEPTRAASRRGRRVSGRRSPRTSPPARATTWPTPAASSRRARSSTCPGLGSTRCGRTGWPTCWPATPGTTSSTSCAATGRPSPWRCRTAGPAG